MVKLVIKINHQIMQCEEEKKEICPWVYISIFIIIYIIINYKFKSVLKLQF